MAPAKKKEAEALPPAKRKAEPAKKEAEAEAATKEAEAGVAATAAAATKEAEAEAATAEAATEEAEAATAAAPAAKKTRLEDIIVPSDSMVKPTSSTSSGSGGLGVPRLAEPQLPKEKDIPRAGCRDFMKYCVPWVNQRMPIILSNQGTIDSDKPMPELAPLVIQDKSSELRTYKESWNATNCLISLKQTGFYEAGGNLTWIDPEVLDQLVPSDDPPLSWIMQYQGFEPEINTQTRNAVIRFPVVMEAAAAQAPPVRIGSDDQVSGGLGVRLRPLSGHAYIYAWYYRAFLAIKNGDLQTLKLLYECALSTTVCMRVSSDHVELAEASTKVSERIRSEQQVLIDNFITFSKKALIIAGSKTKPVLKVLTDKGIRFNGGLMNATMLRCCVQLQVLDDECLALLSQLDREFGSKVLSGNYNKLRALLYGCSTGAKRENVSTENVVWCLNCLLTTLRRKEAEPDEFKVDTFSKGRDGTPSWQAVALAQKSIVEHCQSIVSGLESVNPTLAAKLTEKVMDKFCSHSMFDETFPIRSSGVVGEADDAGADQVATDADAGEEYMVSLSEYLPRGGVILAEILRKTFDGQYDEPLAQLANETQVDAALAELSADKFGQLGKDLREVMRSLHTSEAVVPSNTQSAPKASLRNLVRQKSEGGQADEKTAQAEREDVWKRATTHRKKWVTLFYVKDKKLATLNETYSKHGGGVRAFRGVLNESHRAFVCSSDLLVENAKEPWRQISDPADKDLGDILKFMCNQRDDTDVTMAFDGLSRHARRLMEDTVGKLPTATEVSFTYAKAPNAWCQRRNFFGSKNMEVAQIAMPSQRTRITVKERDASTFNGAGEDSTHFTTYTGIPTLARNHLALIDSAEKAKMTEVPAPDSKSLPTVWNKRGMRGVPLFWMETKSVEAWMQILKDTSVKAVIDLTPGAGNLASACMGVGALYIGFVYNKTHLQWLTNVVDRNSMKYLTESGSYLYQEDLATHVKQLFEELVAPEEKDNDMEEEEEEEKE